MQKLLKTDFEEKYKIYIQENISISDYELKKEFLELLDNSNPKERLKRWNEMKVLITSFKELVHLANPYYLGYGNPNSDILFLGKEKAFNIYQSPELFIHESVNNTLHWKLINQKNEKKDHQELTKELGFNPMFPKSYFAQKTKKRHTWGIYSKIVMGLKDIDIDILNESEDYNNSFFSHCFLSEINYIPSRYSENRKLIEERKNLLKNDFFKNFKTVIIGAKGYLSNDEIKEIFKTEGKGEIISLDNKEAIKYRNNNGQKIIYCNQLSGAAGWTNKAIDKLIDIFKK